MEINSNSPSEVGNMTYIAHDVIDFFKFLTETLTKQAELRDSISQSKKDKFGSVRNGCRNPQ